MRKLLIIATALAVLVCLTATAYLHGMFDKDIPVKFGSSAVAMPKILLLSADSKECQRRRTLDDLGGAVDNIDMFDGSTKVIVYKLLPLINSEAAYYPAEGYSNCESFAKEGPANRNQHGQLATLDERDQTGRNPLRYRQYNPQGKLVKAANLIEAGKKYQTDYFNLAGLITRSETFDLVGGHNESETSYRADGTRLMRQSVQSSESSFNREHFSADGKTLVMQESRSYGHYSLAIMYDNGNSKVSGQRAIGLSELMYFRPDGTLELLVKLHFGRTVSFKQYDKNAKKYLESTWQETKDGQPDANGYRPMVLTRVNEVNAEGRATREFVFRPDGTQEKVTFYKNSAYFEVEIEYKCDDHGNVISSQANNSDGKALPAVIYSTADGSIPVFTVPPSYLVQPQFTVPPTLNKYDAQIDSERPNIHDR
ncbi:hypothetical protein BH11CYA1_BH11CYA1_35910 [soil metagenome]